MGDKLVIIDNEFITKEEARTFKDFVLNHPTALWKLDLSTAYEGNGAAPSDQIKDTHQFVCRPGNVNPILKPAKDLFDKFAKKHGIEYKEITRIKFNVVPRAHASSAGKWHNPHVDTDIPHKVFLYYINDADGDTYFFDKYFQEGDPGVLVSDNLVVERSVTPEMGKGVIFDGLIFHASSSPIESDYRAILNIDFI